MNEVLNVADLEYKISKMTQDDVASVFEIERELLGTSDISTINSVLESETLSYFVLKKQDEIVGFIELSIIEPDCELYDIAIKKDYQGLGLSKILMDFMLDFCKSKHCETIFLEVNSINTIAIRLYRKYGFKNYSVRKNYYGKFDAVLMKIDL